MARLHPWTPETILERAPHPENGRAKSPATRFRESKTRLGPLIGIWLFLLVSAGNTRADAAGTGTREILSGNPPPGWKMSYSYNVPGLQIREFVPFRQTLEDWQDMITAQSVSNTQGGSPAELLHEIARRARSICLDVLSSPVTETRVNGFPAATMSQFCVRDGKSGNGDVTLYQTIRGHDAMHVLSRTRRGEVYDGKSIPLSEEALSGWRSDFAGFSICRQREGGQECGATP